MKLLKQLIILVFVTVSARGQALDTLIEVHSFKLHFKILKGKNSPKLFESGGGLGAEISKLADLRVFSNSSIHCFGSVMSCVHAFFTVGKLPNWFGSFVYTKVHGYEGYSYYEYPNQL